MRSLKQPIWFGGETIQLAFMAMKHTGKLVLYGLTSFSEKKIRCANNCHVMWYVIHHGVVQESISFDINENGVVTHVTHPGSFNVISDETLMVGDTIYHFEGTLVTTRTVDKLLNKLVLDPFPGESYYEIIVWRYDATVEPFRRRLVTTKLKKMQEFNPGANWLAKAQVIYLRYVIYTYIASHVLIRTRKKTTAVVLKLAAMVKKQAKNEKRSTSGMLVRK